MSPETPGSKVEKVFQFDRLVEVLRSKRSEGKKIGLITGGFDIIHKGHISLFRFAKEKVDILVVGVEQDETIALSKGHGRPVNGLVDRCDFLSELSSIDYVFTVPFVFRYGDAKRIDEMFAEIYESLQPDCLITNVTADRFWELKKKRAENMGVNFLGQETEKVTSSSSIASKIQQDI